MHLLGQFRVLGFQIRCVLLQAFGALPETLVGCSQPLNLHSFMADPLLPSRGFMLGPEL